MENAPTVHDDRGPSPSRALLLVHSPLVGPDSWEPVAEQLGRRGFLAIVPSLVDDGRPAFWRQHILSVVHSSTRALPLGVRLAVVAHSGAGQLLGLLGPALSGAGYPIACYILADAGLPQPSNSSRLDQLRAEAPDVAAELHELFESGGAFPDWTDELLRPLIPDAQRRMRLLAGIRRQPLRYWTEPLPAAPQWPDAPVGVLLFSDSYAATAGYARSRRWPVVDMAVGNHLAPLADEVRVTDRLLELVATLEQPDKEQ